TLRSDAIGHATPRLESADRIPGWATEPRNCLVRRRRHDPRATIRIVRRASTHVSRRAVRHAETAPWAATTWQPQAGPRTRTLPRRASLPSAHEPGRCPAERDGAQTARPERVRHGS